MSNPMKSCRINTCIVVIWSQRNTIHWEKCLQEPSTIYHANPRIRTEDIFENLLSEMFCWKYNFTIKNRENVQPNRRRPNSFKNISVWYCCLFLPLRQRATYSCHVNPQEGTDMFLQVEGCWIPTLDCRMMQSGALSMSYYTTKVHI